MIKANPKQRVINSFVYVAIPRPSAIFKKYGARPGIGYSMNRNDELTSIPNITSVEHACEFIQSEMKKESNK